MHFWSFLNLPVFQKLIAAAAGTWFFKFGIKNKRSLGFGSFYSSINKENIHKKHKSASEIIFLSRFLSNVTFSTCDFNIFPLLWSERSGSKFKFFQLFKDFYVNTRPACNILGKKCISILGFGNKPSCACSIWLRSKPGLRMFYLVAQQPPCACSICLRSHFKA